MSCSLSARRGEPAPAGDPPGTLELGRSPPPLSPTPLLSPNSVAQWHSMAACCPDGRRKVGSLLLVNTAGHMSARLPGMLTESPVLPPSPHASSRPDGTAAPLYSESQALVGPPVLGAWFLTGQGPCLSPLGPRCWSSDRGRGGPRGLASGGPARPPARGVAPNSSPFSEPPCPHLRDGRWPPLNTWAPEADASGFAPGDWAAGELWASPPLPLRRFPHRQTEAAVVLNPLLAVHSKGINAQERVRHFGACNKCSVSLGISTALVLLSRSQGVP